MTAKIVLLGATADRLTVIQEEGRYVVCKCSCGNVKKVLRGNFLAGYTKSCGCLQKERVQAANTTHGLSHSQLYTIWKAMRRRCYNPAHRAYQWYGGKGIKVCERWQIFDNFAIDMAAAYRPGLTIDRLDTAADYSKENCQWVTKPDNARRGR